MSSLAARGRSWLLRGLNPVVRTWRKATGLIGVSGSCCRRSRHRRGPAGSATRPKPAHSWSLRRTATTASTSADGNPPPGSSKRAAWCCRRGPGRTQHGRRPFPFSERPQPEAGPPVPSQALTRSPQARRTLGTCPGRDLPRRAALYGELVPSSRDIGGLAGSGGYAAVESHNAAASRRGPFAPISAMAPMWGARHIRWTGNRRHDLTSASDTPGGSVNNLPSSR